MYSYQDRSEYRTLTWGQAFKAEAETGEIKNPFEGLILQRLVHQRAEQQLSVSKAVMARTQPKTIAELLTAVGAEVYNDNDSSDSMRSHQPQS
jgi:hypothetical protein